MRPQLAHLSTFLCLALLTTHAAGDPPRTDRYGDPLPAGVVARLGTERLKLISARFLTFSPDGRRLAAHNGQQDLRVWDVPSGKVLFRLKTPPTSGITGNNPLVFSPDGKAIALASPSALRQVGKGQLVDMRRGTVRVLELATGKELHSFVELQGLAFNLAFSPDGRYLFSAGDRAPLLRWDLSKDGAAKEYGNFHAVESLAVSRDGKTLTAVTLEKEQLQKRTLIRWDVASGKEIGRHTLPAVGGYAGRLSPDGGVYAAPAVDGKSIALLDMLTGRERCQFREADFPRFISFSADGVTMTSITSGGSIRVWNVAEGKLGTHVQIPSMRMEWAAVSPDGKWLALTGRTDGAVHLWDVDAGRELHSFAGHRRGPLTIAFLKGGNEIVTVNHEGQPMPHSPMVMLGPDGGRPVERDIKEWPGWSLRRWDAATGVERAVMESNSKGEAWHTSFSADGRLLATVLHDGTFHLWDVESGKELRDWKGSTREITSGYYDRKGGKTVIKTPYPATNEPVFNPDGKILLAGYGRKIYRWETATGRALPAFEIKEIPQQQFEPNTWCLPSPDGRTLAVWSTGFGDLLLLDSTSGKVKQQLKNRQPWQRHPPAFSPDSRTIAIEEKGAIALWEVARGRLRGRLAEAKGVSGLAFSPDDRLLAVGAGPESPLSLWDLATGQVVGRLRDDRLGGPPIVFSPDGTRLAVAGYHAPDGPPRGGADYCPVVLVCDVAELCGKTKIEEIVKSAVPSPEELEGLWVELSGSDDARAYRAIRQLGLAGPQGAVFLKKRLKDDKLDEQRIARLITDLDDDLFATREKASKELEKLGVRAEPALRRTLEREASAEVRMRVKRLLERLDIPQGSPPSPELVRLRAVEALEANSSKEAGQALAELSESPTDAQLAREAKLSLARLRSRVDEHSRHRQ